jgi:hypothetical protein
VPTLPLFFPGLRLPIDNLVHESKTRVRNFRIRIDSAFMAWRGKAAEPAFFIEAFLPNPTSLQKHQQEKYAEHVNTSPVEQREVVKNQ